MSDFLITTYLGNTGRAYFEALIAFGTSIIVLRIFHLVISQRLRKWVKKSELKLDNVAVEALNVFDRLFYIIVSVYIGLQFLRIHPSFEKGIDAVTLVVITYYFIKALQVVLEYVFAEILKRRGEDESYSTSSVRLLRRLSVGILWGIALVLILQNIGLDITALVAGLGIGGIAIAFALQNILSDIFATFAISFDRPFEVGDFIIVGKDKGTVKKIGIKSTRLKTLQGEELIISNKELTEARVNNYQRMEKRRVDLRLQVAYETSTEKLRNIPKIVEEVVAAQEDARFIRTFFATMGEYSLNFTVHYSIPESSYEKYIKVNQAVLLALKERFDQEGIRFAYPTQTIQVTQGASEKRS